MTFSVLSFPNRFAVQLAGFPARCCWAVEYAKLEESKKIYFLIFASFFLGCCCSPGKWRKVLPNRVSGQQCFDGFLLQLLKIAKSAHTALVASCLACQMAAAHAGLVWSNNEKSAARRRKTLGNRLDGKCEFRLNEEKFKRFRCRRQAVEKMHFWVSGAPLIYIITPTY